MTRVVCAVILEKGRVLACRRPLGKSEGGKWEFPGGKVEVGESDEEALRREIREELGLTVSVGELVGQAEGEKLLLVAYFCRRETESLELREHLEARWVDRWEGDRLDWAALDIPLWGEVRKRL